MSTTYSNGLADLAGDLIGTLRVISIAGRNPVRWNVSCERCGSRAVETHQRLRLGGSCRNAGCGKDAVRETTEDTPAKFRRREEAAEAAKEFAESERKVEQTRKLEREISETHGKVNAAIRERILNGKDVEVYVSPELRTATMTQDEADSFNERESRIFVQSTREWTERFASPENLSTLGSYFDRNGLAIVSYPMIQAAFEKLRDCGALTEKEPATAQEPQQQQTAIEASQPEPLETPTQRTDGMEGWTHTRDNHGSIPAGKLRS